MSATSLEPTSPAAATPRAWRHSALVIALVVIVTFARLFGSEFTFWDDQVTVHHNAKLNPPTLDTLRYYWTTSEAGLYVPVTYTLWSLVARIAFVGTPDEYGIMLNPWAFHAANVLVHLASSLLVLRLLRRLIGVEAPALLGALFFAVHPVQVETVGWISGFKDLLCWCFGLASLLAYLRRAQSIADSGLPRPMWAGWELPLSALLLALAILSKPTAMVVPAAMWVVDGLLVRRRWFRPLIELLPMLALAAGAALLARQAQYVDHLAPTPLWQRPFIVGDAYAFYIRQILWPAQLAIDYGRSPEAVMQSPLVYAWWLVPAALVVVGVWVRRTSPAVLAAVAIFVIGIAPVSGIATFQMQSFSTVTDHYLYFSMLGAALLLAWALARWNGRGLRVAATIAIAALAIRSFVQTGIWQDGFRLFNHTARVNPRGFLAPTNLAITYLRGTPERPDLAEPHIDRAFALSPHQFFVLDAYASVKALLGKQKDAFPAWEEAYQFLSTNPRGVLMQPDYAADVASNMLRIRAYGEAVRWATRSLEANPNHPTAIVTLTAAHKAIAATQPSPTAASPVPPPASAPAAAGGRD